ncbi:PadR family transcriptional regulator [Hypericibacter sp.]|uniref:PadR family transcriptional regulator n=1 Tax=Hypericibacter sp. TaxID=2705401 RepID=UPI003D6D4451
MRILIENQDDRRGWHRHGHDHDCAGRGGRDGEFRGLFGGRGRGGHGGSGHHGGRGFRLGRRLGSSDLQLILLALLAEQPRHGYELIKELEERSHGFYAPSPGMIYPALTYLEEIGFATVEAEANKKLYRINEAGQAFLTENRATADAILAELAEVGAKFAQAQRLMEEGGEAGERGDSDRREDRDAWPLGRRRRGGVLPEILEARRDIKRALNELEDASPEEQARIAAILRRAASDIRGKSG